MGNTFVDYTLKSDFEFLVYVSREILLENEFTNCLGSKDKVPGILRRKEGRTTLQIADHPIKKGAVDRGWITDQDYVSTYKDDGTWYAESFDGSFLFMINKYYFKNFNVTHRSSYTKGVSEWFITDFEISDLFLKDKNLNRFSLDIDLIFEYFNFHMQNGEGKLQKIVFSDIKFDDYIFTIMIGEQRNTNIGLKLLTKSYDAKVVFNFEKKINCNYSFKTMILFRNLMQILMDENVGINKIVLGEQEKETDGSIKDKRRNWFIDQSFVSNITGNINFYNLDTNFEKLKPDFNNILRNYYKNQRLQELISAYVTTFQMKMPVSIILVTLSSGIETYLKDAKYSSNGQTIKNFKKKLELVVKSIDSSKNYSDLIEAVKDSRDFFVHGTERDGARSEVELIPYIKIFREIYRKYIIKELLN